MAKFKTKARALDLLGRQQIAGIPTAINELIKNAHDAYADQIDIDYLRETNLLVIRDNGMGMTRDEFETRWLTLGTESKLSSKTLNLPPKDPNKKLRSIMGEKGIGRLSIALIGSQVLVLTKARNRDQDNKIVAAFINWQLFQLPGLNIDDIAIPVKEFDQIPSASDIDDLKKEILESLIELEDKKLVDEENITDIRNTIYSFNLDPLALNRQLPGAFSLTSPFGGTQFFISPVNEMLQSDIDSTKDSYGATKIEKMLVGFHNTMTPGHPNPELEITFRDYKKGEDSFVNVIDREQFFTPEEFELADHHIQGRFDKYGQFSGTISIYGDKTFEHTVQWAGNLYRETDCGPFSINLAYLQGEQKSSRVSAEDYARIKAKGDKFGGLYIYRNNIRILPYGDSDYDFLDIEKNRSKRASTYFFSYRRMFGVIEIEGSNLSKLTEKAGREGFIENKAYRQLQAILKNFFIQLAADFFNDGSDGTSFFTERKDHYRALNEVLSHRDELVKHKKENFAKHLNKFFGQLSKHSFDKEVKNILKTYEEDLNSLCTSNQNQSVTERVIESEANVRKKLREYRNKISVPNPSGFFLSRDLRIDFETYREEFAVLNSTLFSNAEDYIDLLTNKYIKTYNIELDGKKQLLLMLNQLINDLKVKNTHEKNNVEEVVQTVVSRVGVVIKEIEKEFFFEMESVLKEIEQLPQINLSTEEFGSRRKEFENRLILIADRNSDIMSRILHQFASFYIEKATNGEFISNDQIAEAVSEELDDLRQKVQADIELSQLGLAVGVLNHEFSHTVRAIRGSIKDLKVWGSKNKNIETIYKNIKINFEHLDGYLNLFTPLNRRLNRSKEQIPLMDIKYFLLDLFKARLQRHSVQLIHTRGFERNSIYGFRSTFYPVFVNLVDNAIYWLSRTEIAERIIRLHADGENIYISNNGIPIKPQDKNRIFELRFTRKPEGRGLGLSISKEVLNAEGYDITLDTPRANTTVTFKINKRISNV